MRRRTLPFMLVLATAGCDTGGVVVARAGGHELSLSEAAALLAGQGVPNERDLAQTLAELWVDYILLSVAIAEDLTLDHLDVSGMVEEQVVQQLVVELRDEEMRADTAVSEAQLETRYALEPPEPRVLARHIFVAFPGGESPAARDSVRRVAEALQARVAGGEPFEEVARDRSDDPGTAPDGGALGWLGRGEMAPALESAAFALEPGEVSEVLEGSVGYHVLKVDERRAPTLDESRTQLRAAIRAERTAAAESTLVARVEGDSAPLVLDDALALLRTVTRNPGLRVSGRARRRPLVHYADGEVTLGELIRFMQGRSPQRRLELLAASDEEMTDAFLPGLAHRELLAAEARARGIDVDEPQRDALASQLRDRLGDTAAELGLLGPPTVLGDDPADARERRVTQLLREMLRGGREVIPLGSFSFVLRDHYGGGVDAVGIDRLLERIAEVRGLPAAPPPATPGNPPPDGG